MLHWFKGKDLAQKPSQGQNNETVAIDFCAYKSINYQLSMLRFLCICLTFGICVCVCMCVWEHSIYSLRICAYGHVCVIVSTGFPWNIYNHRGNMGLH